MYQRLVTYYSNNERKFFHSQGIWLTRNGEQQPVRSMNRDRLNKLVNMLATWAMNDEGDVYQNLRKMPIFGHVVLAIRRLGLSTFQARLFLDACSDNSFPDNWEDLVEVPSPDEMVKINVAADDLLFDLWEFYR